MSSPKLFHLAPMLLEIGTILLPGNWGRCIKHPMRNQDQSYVREIAMEERRKLHFVKKPSRLYCIFALPSLNSVRAYQKIGLNVLSAVYEIEPLVHNGPMHLGNWRLGNFYQGQHHLADHYWRGLRVDLPNSNDISDEVLVSLEYEGAEVLIGGKAKIIRRLDESSLDYEGRGYGD